MVLGVCWRSHSCHEVVTPRHGGGVMCVILTAEGLVSGGGATGWGWGKATLRLGRESRLDLPQGTLLSSTQGTGAQDL